MPIRETRHGYTYYLQTVNGGLNRQHSYLVSFIDKSPTIEDLIQILEEIDYLYQTTITIQDNKTVFYTGFTD